MKSVIRKLTALFLALLLTAAPLCVQASVALGDDLREETFSVNHQTELHSGTFWSNTYSDLREENYVTYTPSTRVTPVVTCGGYTTALSTVSAAAEALEEQGYRVVAGINGDYYDTATNIPLGSVMTDGVLRNVTAANYAVGFRADGTCVMGKPQLTITAAADSGTEFSVSALNCLRSSSSGIYLFDHTFNARHSTGTSESGFDVVCSVTDGALSIGGTLTLRVEEVLAEARDTAVEEGQYVLSANANVTEAVETLRTLAVGQTLTLCVTADGEEWNDVTNLIGALYPLLEDGEVCTGLPTGAAPRTAIGLKTDGTVIFYTIDGRQSGYSIGASLTQVAERLLELGCVSAMSLDGGGSTTLVTTVPTDTAASVVNQPSGGDARAVTNHVFLIADARESGGVSHIYLDADNRFVLPNGQVKLTAAALDENYIPTSSAVSLSADSGSIRDGVYTAPAAASGDITVRASAGGERAALTLTVVTAPDGITVRQSGAAVSALSLGRGESVSLTASASYHHLPAAGDNSCFSWSVTGNAGAIDQNGVFTAASRVSDGSIVVSLGTVSVSIPVSVTAEPLRTLETFETSFDAVSGVGATLSHTTANAARGKASARLDYTLSPDAPAQLSLNDTVPAQYDRLNLWLYGDGSGAELSLVTDCGSTETAVLDFAGWRNLSFSLPDGATRLTGLRLSSERALDGSILLDQPVLSYDGLIDSEAPTIALAYEEASGSVSGTVSDDCDGAALSLVRVTYDGAALAYTLAENGTLRFTLPAPDGLLHRITVCAADSSGNLSRRSLDVLPDDSSAAFPDTQEHWANSYIGYLKNAGVTTGDENGSYHPDADITRQEFAVLLYRFLKPDTDLSAVTLPFADAGEIASWAYDGVCAMYALGVVKGTVNGMGESVFAPTDSISRQEAVTMIGRLLEKGYASPALTFPDTASVASWAYDYVSVLSTIGILSGDADGCFHPGSPITRAQVAKVLYKML